MDHRVDAVRLAGGGPEQQTAALNDARRDAVRAQVEAIAAKDPQKALEILEAHKAYAGAYYAPLQERIQGRAYAAQGNSIADAVFKGQPVPGQPAPAPTGVPAASAPAAPAANGLPQEGPMPPVRGDGGSAPASAAATPAAPAKPVQPAYPAWRSTLSKGDQAEFDTIAQKQAARDGSDLPTAQAKLYGQLSAKATAKGAILPGGAPPAAVPQAAPAAPTAQQPIPGQNRDLSSTPVAHPSTLALPYFAGSFANDQSHSLPAPIAGAAALPYFNKAGASYGISGSYLARTWQIESNSGKNKGSSSAGALGDFQFIPSTWAKYGNGGNRMDFGASTMAAVRLAADNKASLTRSLGREPADAEIYLAHQQGAAGAAKLLMNPNARAGDIVGNKAVSSNGGDPNMSAGAFASIWLNKFNGVKPSSNPIPMFASGFGSGQPYYGGPPPAGAIPSMMPDPFQPPPPMAAPASAPAPMAPQVAPAPQAQQAPPPPAVEAPAFRDPKADAYARVEAMNLPQEVKAHVFQGLNQRYQEQQIAEEQDQRTKKTRSDQAYGGYTQRALNGEMGPGILRQIANDPNLLPETKWTLSGAITRESTRQGEDKEARNFGPGYAKTLSAITADADDPSRISDPTQVLHMVHDGSLTLAGADKLIGAMRLGARSADDHAVETAKAGVIRYAKARLSFEDPERFMRDRKGEDIFNSKFVPQYEAGFDRWVKDGKNPMDYIADTKRVDELADRLRPRRGMEADRIAALQGGGEAATSTVPNPFGSDGGEAPQAAAQPQAQLQRPPQPTPPSPPATDPQEWAAIAQATPVAADGQPWPVANWAGAVAALKANPTEANRRAFDRRFGPAGYRADDVLQRLQPKSPMGDQPMGGL